MFVSFAEVSVALMPPIIVLLANNSKAFTTKGANMNFIQNALIFVAWLGVIMVCAGVIGVIGAIFWAFDPRSVKEGGE